MARAYGGTSGSAGGSGFLPTPSRMSLRSWFRFSLVANVLLLLACIHFMHEGGVSPRDLLNSSGHRKPPPPQQKQKFELEYLDTKAPPKAEPVVVEKIVEKIVEKVVEVPMTGSKRAACGMCDVAPELCEELGADNVSRFLGYQGSNQRLRRVLAKMRRGDPFTIGIVGGSVSKGHGIKHHDGLYAPENMHVRIFNYLDDKFPGNGNAVFKESAKDNGKNSFVNGAQGGVGSDYFSMCFGEHIPDDVDLVIIELAINDERLMERQNSFELLVRGLFALPSQPAVINIQTLALVFPNLSMGGDMHAGLSEYYDIPTLSLRNLWLHQILSNYTRMQDIFLYDNGKDYANMLDHYDARHINPWAHGKTAELVSAYIDTQLCEMDRLEETMDKDDIVLDEVYPQQEVPRQLVLDKFAKDKVMPPVHPNCFSTNGVRSPLVAKDNDGWRSWNWQEKKYLIADEPGSSVSFDFETVIGSVELYYQRSKKYGLGSVFCWVDGDKDRGQRIDGYWDLQYNIGRSTTLRKDLKPGKHVLHCELLKDTLDPGGGKEFRIISVMSI